MTGIDVSLKNGQIVSDLQLCSFDVIHYAFCIVNCHVVSSLYLQFDNDIINIKYVRESLMGVLFSGTHCTMQSCKNV